MDSTKTVRNLISAVRDRRRSRDRLGNISETLSGEDMADLVLALAEQLGYNASIFSGSLPVDDTTSLVRDPADTTKQARIDVGALTTGTTRTLVVPDQDVDLTPSTGDFASSSEVLKKDGSVGLTNDWNAGGGAYDIQARVLKSDVITGTAPLTIASTTLISNLNADLLDGVHASAFANSIHAVQHTSGLDDIQSATAAQKGLATAAQITKLDGIEALADVTDEANVTAAHPISDATTLVKDPADATKLIRLDAGNVPTGTTRVIYGHSWRDAVVGDFGISYSRSGLYYDGAMGASDLGAPIVPTANRMYFRPFFVQVRTAYDQIMVAVSTVSDVLGTARLGLYYFGTNGLPGTLLLDAGTVTLAATGDRAIAISLTLDPGVYYSAIASSSATADFETLDIAETGAWLGLTTGGSHMTQHLYANSIGVGALPDPWSAALTDSSSRCPRVHLRAV